MKIEVEMRDVSEIKGLRKSKQLRAEIERITELKLQIEAQELELRQLKSTVMDKIWSVVPPEEKSVQYEDFRLTRTQQSARRTLDTEKLLKYIPASKLEKCYKVGKQPEPSLTVTTIKGTETDSARQFTKESYESSK